MWQVIVFTEVFVVCLLCLVRAETEFAHLFQQYVQFEEYSISALRYFMLLLSFNQLLKAD